MELVRKSGLVFLVLFLGACTQNKLSAPQDAAPVMSTVPLPIYPFSSGIHSGTPRSFKRAPPANIYKNRENYQNTPENEVKRVTEAPVSTFSIDVDTASYSNMRRMLLNEGRMPPKNAVRIEELINYFDYSYQQPASTEQPFSVNTEVAPAPWNDELHLIQIGLKGYEPQTKRPDANLVFLIDVSGSMGAPGKLPLVKKSLRLLAREMRSGDRIAVVVYSGAAGLVLESTSGAQKNKIIGALDRLRAGGGTHGSAGIQLAYEVAEEHWIENGINRVIIASDGDMNVGITDLDKLLALIKEKRKSGIALTTLGFGTGNYNDALMEQLADAGNGTAAYIDNLNEAKKVLVTEINSTLLTIASDVKVQVEFNPLHVSEYRLIGYENRVLRREDFTNDKVDAGDIGAGHTVTALYEIALTRSGADRIPPLRYGTNQEVVAAKDINEIAFVKLRYKRPGESQSIELTHVVEENSIIADFEDASRDFRFASAVAAFGEQLRGSRYATFSLAEVMETLKLARGDDKHGYQRELISLVDLAMSIGSPG